MYILCRLKTGRLQLRENKKKDITNTGQICPKLAITSMEKLREADENILQDAEIRYTEV